MMMEPSRRPAVDIQLTVQQMDQRGPTRPFAPQLPAGNLRGRIVRRQPCCCSYIAWQRVSLVMVFLGFSMFAAGLFVVPRSIGLNVGSPDEGARTWLNKTVAMSGMFLGLLGYVLCRVFMCKDDMQYRVDLRNTLLDSLREAWGQEEFNAMERDEPEALEILLNLTYAAYLAKRRKDESREADRAQINQEMDEAQDYFIRKFWEACRLNRIEPGPVGRRILDSRGLVDLYS